jgi:hypothetical protein
VPTTLNDAEVFSPLSEPPLGWACNRLDSASTTAATLPSAAWQTETYVPLATLIPSDEKQPTPRGRTLTNPNPFPALDSTPLGMGFNGTQPSAYAGTAGTVGYRQRNAFPEQALSNMAPDLGFNPNEAVSAPGPSPSRSRQSTALSSRKRLSDMTPRERDGLLGLAARLDPEHPDFSQLAVGHDLTQLGLEISRPECVLRL